MAERCVECGGSISGDSEAVTSDGRSWHPSCLLCNTCSKSLCGEYYVSDGRPTCPSCYEAQFMCQRCNKLISDVFQIKDGKKWHPECCNDPCAYCGKPILDASFIALGKVFHTSCWLCSGCGGKLEKTFIPHNGAAYCTTCMPVDSPIPPTSSSSSPSIPSPSPSVSQPSHSTTNSFNLLPSAERGQSSAKGSRLVHGNLTPHKMSLRKDTLVSSRDFSPCTFCGKDVPEGITWKDKLYHASCLKCCVCSKCVADTKFFSKGDKPYCSDCFTTQFSSKCHGCKGCLLGGYIVALDKNWHKECFVCAKCKQAFRQDFFYEQVDGSVLCDLCTPK